MNISNKSIAAGRAGRSEPDGGPGARARALKRACNRALKHERRKLKKRQQELLEASRWPWFGQIADSLMAEPGRYPRGTGLCSVRNLHTGAREQVRLNTKLSAPQNARIMYRKASKGRRGEEIARGKVAETTQRIGQIEKIAARLSELDTAAADAEQHTLIIQQELESLGIAPRAAPGIAGGASKERGTAYRRFEIDGFEVFVGRTETQNDELTTRFAKPWDIWMHVAAHSGSHVVLRRRKGADWPPRAVLEKAGSLAVWFSKARHTSYAEVHVTEARFVRKPRKAPPGKVVAERGKTIRVSPKAPREMFPLGDSRRDHEER